MISRIRALIARLIPTGTVAERSAKSGVWGLATKVSSRGLQLLMLIILARLLTPREFGLMGIALLALGATKQFTQIGLNAALIQQVADDVDEYLDTTWCLEIARGLLIATVVFAGAPFIATFFGEPEATNVLRLIALVPVLTALRNPGVVYFKKDLAFHKDFLYRGAGGAAQLIVGVSYAMVSPTVYALVVAFLASEAVQLVLSYRLHGYRPWFSFDLGQAIELIHYGKWITGSSVVYFLYSEGDDAFVGWYLTATALGFYQYAYRLADTPSTEVAEVIAQIAFPTYSKLQTDTARLRAALLETIRLTAFLTFPMAIGIAMVAPLFVPVVLGDDWIPMIPLLQLLALYGLLHAITRSFGSLWKALGRPDLTAKLPLVGVVLIAITIWPATARWGVLGTAAVVVGFSFIPVFPLNVYVTAKLVDTKSWRLYREYLYPSLASLTMAVGIWAVSWLTDLPLLVELVLVVPLGAAIYLTSALVLERRFGWGIGENLRRLVDGVLS